MDTNKNLFSKKSFTMTVLNALALGVVVTLIPGAILGELTKSVITSVSSRTINYSSDSSG